MTTELTDLFFLFLTGYNGLKPQNKPNLLMLILPKLCLQGKLYFPGAPTLKLKHLYTRSRKKEGKALGLLGHMTEKGVNVMTIDTFMRPSTLASI